MIKFIEQILLWVPELKGKLILATIYKILESIFMGAPYVFIFLCLNDLLAGSLTINKVILYTGGMFFCFAMQALFSYRFNRIIRPAANYTVKELRIMAGEHLRKLSMGYFAKKNTGTLNTMMVEEMVAIQTAIYNAFSDFIIAFTFILVMPAVLMCIDWRLALAAVVCFPAAVPFLYWGSRVFERGLKTRSDSLSRVNSQIIDYVQGIEVLKAFKDTDRQFAKTRTTLHDFKKTNISLVNKAYIPTISAKIMLDLGLGVTLLVATVFLFNETISLTVFLIFLIMSLRIYDPVKRLIPAIAILRLAGPGMTMLKELLETKPLPQPKAHAENEDEDEDEDEDKSQPLQSFDIHFEDVSFSYEDEKVLEGISFTIPEKTITALVGPSGSGKTTITRLIARFWDIDSGRITMGGKDIRDMQIDSLLARVSMVFQDVYLFNDTIYQNIAYGSKDADKQKIIAAAKTAQCHDFIDALPDGYKTMVGEGGATLSGGEKQRISIARAILKDAPVILLDEATASMDPGNEYLVQNAINALVESKTLIIIAHRLSTITSADQIIVLNENGRVEEIGRHAELIDNKSLYSRLWQDRTRAKQWQIKTGKNQIKDMNK